MHEQYRSFLTHYCEMVCTPTGLISTTDLINTDSIKETEESQENPAAAAAAAEETLSSTCALPSYTFSFHLIKIHTKINNYHKTKPRTK